MKRAIVLTTINEPIKAVIALNEGAIQHNSPFIVVGDTKTPNETYQDFSNFYSV